jgi:hypothetical protein
MFQSFIGDWSPFGVAAKLLWVAQLGLIVHVFKTGRPYFWFWILLMAPALGGIAYVLVELLPDFTATGSAISWKPRAWRIRDLRAELEESDTVKLRLALAAELFAARQADEACATAEECLHGVFRDDPHTLASVARYRLESGKTPGALAALEQIKIESDRLLATNVAAQHGDALVTAGRHAEAQAALRSIEGSLFGEEPRYFLAVSLAQTGQLAEARELWLDIQKRFRRAGRGWRRAEKRWFKLAGERLAETKP